MQMLCRVGVTSEPECTIVDLTPQDKFIILASDGVWEFISSQEAVDIVGNCTTVEEGCRQVNDSLHSGYFYFSSMIGGNLCSDEAVQSAVSCRRHAAVIQNILPHQHIIMPSLNSRHAHVIILQAFEQCPQMHLRVH